MKAYFVLLKMQLYLKLSALKPSNWIPKKAGSLKEWKPLLMGLIYLLVAGSMVGTVIFLSNGLLWAFYQLKAPELLLSSVVMISMMLTFFIGFFHVTSILFFSKDSTYLASLPVSSRTVMAVRLSIVLLGEIALIGFIFIPICIMYGIHTGQNAFFYIKAILTIPLIPCIPLAIASLLSLVLVRITSVFRHRDRWAVIGGFLLMALIIPLQMQFYKMIPKDAGVDFFLRIIYDNQSLVKSLLGGFPPVLWATVGIAGHGAESALLLLLFASVSLIAASVPTYFGKRYLQMAIMQNEAFQTGKHKRLTAKDYKVMHKPVAAIFLKEWKEMLRIPAYALNGLAGIIMMPIMLVAFYMGMEGSNELSLLIGQLLRSTDGYMIALVAAAAMALVSTINTAGFTAVSREGKRFPFSRMIPVPFKSQLLGKHLFGVSINAVTCLTTFAALIVIMPSQFFYILLAFIMGLLFAFGTNAIGLIMDVSHPRLNWRNETEAIKQNPISLLSMLIGVVTAAAFGFGAWFLWKTGISLALVTWILFLVLVLYALVMHAFLSRGAHKWYLNIEM